MILSLEGMNMDHIRSWSRRHPNLDRPVIWLDISGSRFQFAGAGAGPPAPGAVHGRIPGGGWGGRGSVSDLGLFGFEPFLGGINLFWV